MTYYRTYVKHNNAQIVRAQPLRNFTPLCLWRQTRLYDCIFCLHYLTRKLPLCGVTLSPYFVKRGQPTQQQFYRKRKKNLRDSCFYCKRTIWAVKIIMTTSFFTKWRLCSYVVNYFFGLSGSAVCFVNVSYTANQVCVSVSYKILKLFQFNKNSSSFHTRP